MTVAKKPRICQQRFLPGPAHCGAGPAPSPLLCPFPGKAGCSWRLGSWASWLVATRPWQLEVTPECAWPGFQVGFGFPSDLG